MQEHLQQIYIQKCTDSLLRSNPSAAVSYKPIVTLINVDNPPADIEINSKVFIQDRAFNLNIKLGEERKTTTTITKSQMDDEETIVSNKDEAAVVVDTDAKDVAEEEAVAIIEITTP